MNKNVAESVATNTTVLLGSQLVTWLSSFVLMLFLPRYLGSEDYGHLYLGISVAMILYVFLEFGGAYYITKEVARDRSTTPYILVNSVALRFVFWVVAMALMVVFMYVAGYPHVVKLLILIFVVSKLWEGFNSVLRHCFRGHEIMKYVAAGNVTERVFVALVGVVALLLGAGSITIALLMAISTLLNFLVCSRFMRRFVSFLPRIDLSYMKRLAREGAPYFLWSLFGVIYYRIDAVLLSLMVPAVVVGWYGAAYRFFDILLFLPNILNMAVFPVFSRLWAKEDDVLRRTTQKCLELVVLASIPISIGGLLFSNEIIDLFFGLKEYWPTVSLLKIFSAGLPVIYMNFILISVVIASDKQRTWTKVAFGAMLFNPSLNLFLIPWCQTNLGDGGIGAAVATLATESFLFAMAISIIPKSMFAHLRTTAYIKGIIAGMAMVGTALLMNHFGLPWVLGAAASVVAYVSALLFLKTFTHSELALMRDSLAFWKGKEVATVPVFDR
jgi:O-antigen/teichoic acid export membrane protein